MTDQKPKKGVAFASTAEQVPVGKQGPVKNYGIDKADDST